MLVYQRLMGPNLDRYLNASATGEGEGKVGLRLIENRSSKGNSSEEFQECTLRPLAVDGVPDPVGGPVQASWAVALSASFAAQVYTRHEYGAQERLQEVLVAHELRVPSDVTKLTPQERMRLQDAQKVTSAVHSTPFSCLPVTPHQRTPNVLTPLRF